MKLFEHMLLAALLALPAVSVVAGRVPDIFPLWPDGAPAAGKPDEARPRISVYRPEQRACVTAAVLICPGGGYGNLALGHEGKEIAEWLNGLGITGVVLEYRNARGGYRHPVPLMDAQRAMRFLRARADELGIDRDRIGIMGFSAGGHLASTVGVTRGDCDPDAADPIERVSSRPDFMILCYPVIAFGEHFTHRGSQRNLIGANPPEELVRLLSSEKQVDGDVPPTFLFHTDADTGVPAENSIAFYLALRKAGVPAELHVYRNGQHGLGLASGVDGTRDWSRACEQWMRSLGVVE